MITPVRKRSRVPRARRATVGALLAAAWLVAARLVAAWLVAAGGLTSSAGAEPPPDFERQIRPLLAQHCVRCHGPDAAARQAALRLDQGDAATSRLPSGRRAIVPGAPESSELLRRIATADPAVRMPPDDAPPLDAGQQQLLRRWIAAGAPWGTHWAYRPVARPPLPPVAQRGWPRTAVDYFVLAAQESRQLKPSAPAERESLIRRLSFDLRGLPPAWEEVVRFVADPAPDAYPRLVDRFLASPQYGERMAIPWLDAARYADTHGYHVDSHREMWPWRQWVIEAFNANLPFDQFTVEQLAGDLLPGATLEQQIASGFHRNAMINLENGAIPEEYLLEYVADRTITTATVWLGQTFQCARCHDHKYDPFTQRDFYRLSAFFHNIDEQGLDGARGNAAPQIAAPTRLQQARLESLAQRQTQLAAAMQRRLQETRPARHQWERGLAAAAPDDAPNRVLAGLLLHSTFDHPAVERDGERDGEPAGSPPQAAGPAQVDPAQVINVAGGPPGRIVGRIQGVPGKRDRALLFTGSGHVDFGKQIRWDGRSPLTLAAWVFPTTRHEMAIIARADDEQFERGYDLRLVEGKLCVSLVRERHVSELVVRAREPLKLRTWHHVAASLDGTQQARGVRLYVDGSEVERTVARDDLAGSIQSDWPLLVGRRGGQLPFRGMLDDVRIYRRALPPAEVAMLSGANPLAEIARLEPRRRTPAQQQLLDGFYLRTYDQPYQQLQRASRELEQARAELLARVPTTMVMRERADRRTTHVLTRGDYRLREDAVEPGVPEFLAGAANFPAGRPASRLDLARWLVDPSNPLTARVTVNRVWQQFFGRGLVSTSDDFGTRGAAPSHPRLLDYLAAEFVAHDWDLKWLVREIVLSATYRQSSRGGASRLADPDNRYYSRMERLPLPAELVRDNALAIGGLLDQRLGGPSVFPYQPPGLWAEISYDPRTYTAQVYQQSSGADLYRRSLYTFWKRTAPPPSLELFNAPSRETCVVQRSRQRTPLQTLVLLNDPTYVEAARGLAQRALLGPASHPSHPGARHPGASVAGEAADWEFRDEQLLRAMFRAAVARGPTAGEEQVLRQSLRTLLRQYRADPASAVTYLSVGQLPASERLGVERLAAWTAVASMLLNLEETQTRP